MFLISKCSHSFCKPCLKQHAATAAQAKKPSIRCPNVDCIQSLSAAVCETLLSAADWQTSQAAAAEHAVPKHRKVYCPAASCSALITLPETAAADGLAVCPKCSKEVCALCREAAHPFATCEKTRSSAFDAHVMNMAAENKWRACPECREMIELKDGCNHMKCRCAAEFCFKCGELYKDGSKQCDCGLHEGCDQGRQRPAVAAAAGGHGTLLDEMLRSMTLADSARPARRAGTRIDSTDRRYRTAICRYWRLGNCRHGSQRIYAHGRSELRGWRARYYDSDSETDSDYDYYD